MLQSALLAHDTPVTKEKTEGTSQMVALRTALLFSTGMMLDVECIEVAGSGKQAAKAIDATDGIHNTEGNGAGREQVLVDSTTVVCAVPRLLPIAVRTWQNWYSDLCDATKNDGATDR